MLGRPFGSPNVPDFQRKVLRALLALVERPVGPVLEDFLEEAPEATDHEGGFACPVSFAPEVVADGLADRLRDEIARLAPWYDLAQKRRGRTTVGLFGAGVDAAALHIASYLDGAPRRPPVEGWSAGMAVKRACDDVKAYYYEAVAARPGNLAPRAIESWFWNETAAAKAFLAIRDLCLKSDDESLKPLGKLSLIPRAVADAAARRVAGSAGGSGHA